MILPVDKICQTNLCNEVVSTVETTGPCQKFLRCDADREAYPFCIGVPVNSDISTWIKENIHSGWQDDDLIRFEMTTMTMVKYYYFANESDATWFLMKWA